MADKLWVGTDSGNEGDWSVAANWSPSGVPASADDVYLRDSSQAVTAGFAQSAVTLDSLNIAQSFTGQIATHLAIGATVLDIGRHDGPGSPSGSSLLKIDLGTAQSAVTIHNSGNPTTSTASAIQLLAVHVATTVVVAKGKWSLAGGYGEVSTVASIFASFVTNSKTDVQSVIGAGVTLTTLDACGQTYMACAATTINNWGGTITTSGSGAIATINNYASAILNGDGTVTAYNGQADSSADATRLPLARTFTNIALARGASIKIDPDYVTVTNGITTIAAAGPVTIEAA